MMSPAILFGQKGNGNNQLVDPLDKQSWEVQQSVILVADDDAMSRNLVTSLMQRDGHVVLSAANAQQGLELSRGYPGSIDLVITEMRMARLNGTDLCARLLKERPGIKALVMSSSSTSVIVGHNANFTILPEPSDGHILRAIVRAILAASVQQPMHWLPSDPLR
jgi:DNA-binding response OmpR family regulator